MALTPEQAGLYEAVVREGLAAVADADGVARRGLVVKLLTSLKQICNHPAQYLKEDNPRLAGRSGKLALFDELLDAIVAGGASVLVFTQYVRMARLLRDHLAARGVGSLLLHGGTPVARREELVARFTAGEAPVFLLSLRAAGTGLNLTRAEHVMHFDRWWNPAVEAQATDRAHRIGQHRPVQVHRLVADGRSGPGSPRCCGANRSWPTRYSVRERPRSPNCPTPSWRAWSNCGRRTDVTDEQLWHTEEPGRRSRNGSSPRRRPRRGGDSPPPGGASAG